MTTQSHTPEAVVQLEKIGQIAITVTDLPRAKDFYQNTLGMRFLFEAAHMAFFQCGEIRLMISAGEAQAAANGTLLYFRVEDIQAVHAELANRGVEIVSAPHIIARMPDHDLWLAWIKDPDGNLLGLMSEVRQPGRVEFMPQP